MCVIGYWCILPHCIHVYCTYMCKDVWRDVDMLASICVYMHFVYCEHHGGLPWVAMQSTLGENLWVFDGNMKCHIFPRSVCVYLLCVWVYTVCVHWELMQLQFLFALPCWLKCWRTYCPKLTQAIILPLCVCSCMNHTTHSNSRLNVLWLCYRRRLHTHMPVNTNRHTNTCTL